MDVPEGMCQMVPVHVKHDGGHQDGAHDPQHSGMFTHDLHLIHVIYASDNHNHYHYNTGCHSVASSQGVVRFGITTSSPVTAAGVSLGVPAQENRNGVVVSSPARRIQRQAFSGAVGTREEPVVWGL